MEIPDFQTVMLPALKAVASKNVSTGKEVIAAVIEHFKLSKAEQDELLPSGRQRIIDNRTMWALSYMGKAGLIDKPGRGQFSISELGRKSLKENPTRIDINFLNQFESFRQFRTLRHDKNKEKVSVVPTTFSETRNPLEEIERSYEDFRTAVVDELLKTVRGLDPTDFEKLVVELLKKMGYGVPGLESVLHSGKAGDGGIDGEISQDPLGLDMIYVQAKRYAEDSPVGRPALQQFAGSLNERKAKKGIFITTSYFTSDAKNYIDRVDVKIVLIDGVRLADLMYDHNLGVEIQQVFEVKKLNLDFFGEE